ncbi:hypothetical protein PBAL39_00095 [Pedobacter sp. BAL39]|uniref:DUF4397 domain-containing protein n=1 Tax=Pedobacter sp. BAL39 TaxID=391596 RepID=UPI0001559E78|nr:DUF4397 domain-containing protein [Pedobacter sp. BAL39]EDM34885.1 hypothetical protein PBAL39_00095 [Pedobacter sp. BAL39]
MKKLIFLYIQSALFLSMLLSCKKELSQQDTASLTIVNAMYGSDLALFNFDPNFSPAVKPAAGMVRRYRSYDPGGHITIPIKEQFLKVYKYPLNTQDQSVFQYNFTPAAGDASTLFFSGTIQQPESVLITNLPPYHAVADSVLGLRFVNLAPAKTPVRIRISGEGTDLTVTNLAYQAATDYLSVNADAKVGNVLVEVFDQASGSILQTYTLMDVGTTTMEKNKWRYRNYTLAWLPNDLNGNLAAEPFLIEDF